MDSIRPLFEGNTFDQYLAILMVQSLANVILTDNPKKKLLKEEENGRKQKDTIKKKG